MLGVTGLHIPRVAHSFPTVHALQSAGRDFLGSLLNLSNEQGKAALDFAGQIWPQGHGPPSVARVGSSLVAPVKQKDPALQSLSLTARPALVQAVPGSQGNSVGVAKGQK